MEELILLVQKTYGLAGVLLLAPFLATVAMWRVNLKLQTEVVRATEQATEAQKQRVEDAKSISAQLISAVKEQAALNGDTNAALERIGDILNELQTRLMKR